MRRRDLLRGMGLGAGATLLAPMVRGLVGEAHGAAPNKRFLMILGRWSYAEKYLMPTTRSETDFDLNPTMAPVDPFKKDLLLVTGLYCSLEGANGGHGHDAPTFMSVGKSGGASFGPQGTFDRFLGKQIGATDRFPSLSLISGFMGFTPYEVLSWDSPTKSYPSIANPVDAYAKIFGAAAAGPGADTKALLAQDRSVLDFVNADVARLNARLAGPERAKLERFTESLRELERKLSLAQAPAAAACQAPAAPDAKLKSLGGDGGAGGGASVAAAEAQVDIATAALTCGLSRVAVVWMGHYNHTGLGAPEADVHNVFHGDMSATGTTGWIGKLHGWRLGQVAKAVTKLRGAGLGDSTLVAYSDPNGTIHHGGSGSKHFMLMVGGLGGRIRTGRHVNVPFKSRFLGDMFVAMSHAMDAPVERFGMPSNCTGLMPGILA